MCIPNSLVCNERVDCPAGQDEPLNKCNQDECKKDNGGCEHLCVDTPAGFYCDCQKGYVYCNRLVGCDDDDGDGHIVIRRWPPR